MIVAVAGSSQCPEPGSCESNHNCNRRGVRGGRFTLTRNCPSIRSRLAQSPAYQAAPLLDPVVLRQVVSCTQELNVGFC